MTRLETDRLVLREYEEADLPTIHAFASDPVMVQYLEFGPNTQAETRAFYRDTVVATRRAEPRRTWHLVAAPKAGGGIVGAGRITIEAHEHQGGSIGYWVMRPSWGGGYATEIARGLLRFGFGELGLHRIFAIVEPDNVASVRVLARAGMRLEGRLRDHRFAKGTWRDSLLYAALAHEWPEHRMVQ
jgi:ribosomal-protein-alanine N-acetyltransferase